MKPKYTKGPWKVSCQFGGATEIKSFHTITDSENRLFVALADTRASANLIAAAPEMLEALCSIYYMANLQLVLESKYSKPTVAIIMSQLESAIAKARGES